MIRKLTHIEVSRVDALCMGPAENQCHPLYKWDADQVRRMMTDECTPSLWEKVKDFFRLGW